MDGLLPVWKPTGVTSYDVIRRVKKLLPRGYKIGHAGTLDPFAEGVLILMLGRSATKRFDEIQSWPKMYRAVARLGAYSDTLDRTGKIDSRKEMLDSSKIQLKHIQNLAQKFVGEIEQSVPQYSAAKYKGKALYTYARRGIETPEKKKKVTLYSIKVIDYKSDTVEFVVTCSSGTYIRQLSYDIFHLLGIDSYLDTLVREQVGEIDREQSLSINQLENGDMGSLQIQLHAGAS